MRSLRFATAALGILLALAGLALAGTERAGRVSDVSEDAIEIDGQRILLGPASRIMGEGGEVSAASLRRGMLATAEIDDAGRLIWLRVNQVIE